MSWQANRAGAHKENYWLHWNMRDENYGFYAIERRYQMLEGEPYAISDDRKIDILRLSGIYTVKSILMIQI